jgi:hypothetical protein
LLRRKVNERTWNTSHGNGGLLSGGCGKQCLWRIRGRRSVHPSSLAVLCRRIAFALQSTRGHSQFTRPFPRRRTAPKQWPHTTAFRSSRTTLCPIGVHDTSLLNRCPCCPGDL